MKLISDVRRVLACAMCATLVCSAAVAKPAKAVRANSNSKTGIVTSISLDVKKDTVTVTLALGTLKTPSNGTASANMDKKNPPKRPEASDLIELSGETVTFTVAADTEVARAMLFAAPAKDSADTTDTADAAATADSGGAAFPPPPFGDRPQENPPMGNPPEGTPPDMSVEISDVSVSDVLTVSFDTDGTTVTSISEDSAEPPHGPNGMMSPRSDMNGNGDGPQGGFGGLGQRSGPSGGRR